MMNANRNGCDRRSVLVGFCLLWGAVSAQAATLYVNPVSGNDGNPGTQALPLKNIGRALQLARDPINGIHLAAGTYSVDTGERFGWILSGRNFFIGPADRAAIIDGAGRRGTTIQVSSGGTNFSGVTLRNVSLTLDGGSVGVSNGALENFAAWLPSGAYFNAVDVDIRGSSEFEVQDDSLLAFERVNVDGAGNLVHTFLRAANGGHIVASELDIHDLVTPGPVIDIVDADLDLSSSSISDSWGTEAEATVAVSGEDSTVTIMESSITGSAGSALFGEVGTLIKIEGGGTYTGNSVGVHTRGSVLLNYTTALQAPGLFRNSVANVRVEGPEAGALIREGNFRGGTYGVQSYDNARITVIDSTFRGVSRPIQFESVDASTDLGLVGQNLTFLGGASNYSSVVARCTGSGPVRISVWGSRWLPNTQGSDSNGHFEAQTIRGVKKGNNYWLKNSNCHLVVD